jgi:hypothetical protein
VSTSLSRDKSWISSSTSRIVFGIGFLIDKPSGSTISGDCVEIMKEIKRNYEHDGFLNKIL